MINSFRDTERINIYVDEVFGNIEIFDILLWIVSKV